VQVEEGRAALAQPRCASGGAGSAAAGGDAGTVGGRVDMEYYRLRELYLQGIRAAIADSERAFEVAEAERRKVLAEYEKVRREYRAIETMKERRMQEHRKAWFKEEEKATDDIVSSRAGTTATVGGIHEKTG